MGDEPTLDDALIEACQREQQGILGYSETRDEIARRILVLTETSPGLTRDQLIERVGMVRASS